MSTTRAIYRVTKVLPRMFPGKAFHLGEYGCDSFTSVDFSGFAEGEATRARYLGRAYAFAGRHSRVQTHFWLLIGDVRPAGSVPDRVGGGLALS